MGVCLDDASPTNTLDHIDWCSRDDLGSLEWGFVAEQVFDDLLSYDAPTDFPAIDVFSNFRPTESSALTVIWNLAITESPSNLLIPARHTLAPISAWSTALKQKLRLLVEFNRLKNRADCTSAYNENLQAIPRIPSFASEILHSLKPLSWPMK